MIAAEAVKLLTAAAVIFPTVRPDADAATAWASVLGDVTLAEAAAALQVHARTVAVPPLPAHIRTLVTAARTEAAQRRVASAPERHACPRPANYAAMSAAASDPVRFAVERTKYHDQLRDAGHADCIRSTS